jgi:exonuclease III
MMGGIKGCRPSATLVQSDHHLTQVVEVKSGKSTLNCVLFNAHSICNKLCDLDEFLTHDRPDIIFITESWLTPDITNSMLDQHDVYDIYRCDRSEKTGGGVVILCRRSLQSCQIAIDNKFSDLEAVNIQLTCRNSVYNFINIYRPPGTNLQSKLKMSTLTSFLRHTCLNKFTNIVVGDFNTRLINWSTLVNVLMMIFICHFMTL